MLFGFFFVWLVVWFGFFFLILLLGLLSCLINIESIIQRKVRIKCVRFQLESLSDILSDLVLLLGWGKKIGKKGKSECSESFWHAQALTSCSGVHLKLRTIIMPQETVTQHHILTGTATRHTHAALCCDNSSSCRQSYLPQCVYPLSSCHTVHI